MVGWLERIAQRGICNGKETLFPCCCGFSGPVSVAFFVGLSACAHRDEAKSLCHFASAESRWSLCEVLYKVELFDSVKAMISHCMTGGLQIRFLSSTPCYNRLS